MTKEELFIEAKKRYPIGTRIISAESNYEDTINNNWNDYNLSQDIIYNNHTSIYYKGIWATIVRYPKDYIKETYCEIY